MIEVLEFIFADIIHFIGTIILLSVVIEGITEWIKVAKTGANDK